MDRKEDREMLRKLGFGEDEALRLSTLRKHHVERTRLLAIAEHRRMEFVRWLVTIGKITDQIA
jgi:hypothetical protein